MIFLFSKKKRIKTKKPNIKEFDQYGLNMLHWACMCNQVETAEKLIQDHKADVNEISKHGLSPIMYGAIHGHKKVIEMLIRNKATIPKKEEFTKITRGSVRRLLLRKQFDNLYFARVGTLNPLIFGKNNQDQVYVFGFCENENKENLIEKMEIVMEKSKIVKVEKFPFVQQFSKKESKQIQQIKIYFSKMKSIIIDFIFKDVVDWIEVGFSEQQESFIVQNILDNEKLSVSTLIALRMENISWDLIKKTEVCIDPIKRKQMLHRLNISLSRGLCGCKKVSGISFLRLPVALNYDLKDRISLNKIDFFDNLKPNLQNENPGVISMKLFSNKFIDDLLKEIKEMEQKSETIDKYGLYLEHYGFGNLFCELIQQLNPIAQKYDPLVKIEFQSAFLVRYSEFSGHPIHSDASDLTLNTCLYQKGNGGALVFSDKNFKIDPKLKYCGHQINQSEGLLCKEIEYSMESSGPMETQYTFNPNFLPSTLPKERVSVMKPKKSNIPNPFEMNHFWKVEHQVGRTIVHNGAQIHGALHTSEKSERFSFFFFFLK